MNLFDNKSLNSSEIDRFFEKTLKLFELRKAEDLCSVIAELESDSNPEHPHLKAVQYLIRELVRVVLNQPYGKLVIEKLTETASQIPEMVRNETVGKVLLDVLEANGFQNLLSNKHFSLSASVTPDNPG